MRTLQVKKQNNAYPRASTAQARSEKRVWDKLKPVSSCVPPTADERGSKPVCSWSS